MYCIFTQLQQYKSKLDKYKETLNTEQINPDLIKQNLVLGNEPTAIANYEILGNNSNLFFHGKSSPFHIAAHNGAV